MASSAVVHNSYHGTNAYYCFIHLSATFLRRAGQWHYKATDGLRLSSHNLPRSRFGSTVTLTYTVTQWWQTASPLQTRVGRSSEVRVTILQNGEIFHWWSWKNAKRAVSWRSGTSSNHWFLSKEWTKATWMTLPFIWVQVLGRCMLHVMLRYLHMYIFGCLHTCRSVYLVQTKGKNDTLLPFISGSLYV